MRAVGIRQLKDRLSEYVRLAAAGETVLVTDRDRVVAELGPPQAARPSRPLDAVVADWVRRGLATPPSLPVAPVTRPADDDGGSVVAEKQLQRTKPPQMYQVVMLNDDYTPMEFVVYVLERFFQKSREDATRIMLHVHQHGVGVCGVFTYEVAETKVAQVIETARRHQHPLQCTMEKD